MPKGVRVTVDADDLVSRYRAGETTKQLMAAFSIGQPRLVAILAEHGIDPSPDGAQPRRRKLSPEQQAEIVRRYKAGEGTVALGVAFGISARSVTDHLRRAGVQARPKAHGVVAYQAGLSAEEKSVQSSVNMRRHWDTLTDEQREARVAAAHAATLGVARPEEVKEAIAAAKEARGGSDSLYEDMLAGWLTERGVDFRQQVRIGPYCADFTIGNVAIEVTTDWARKKEWGPRFARFFDEGWHLYVAWHNCKGTFVPGIADDLVAWTQILEWAPTPGGEHRVIWGPRQVLSTGRADADYVASVLKSSTPRGFWPFYDRPGD